MTKDPNRPETIIDSLPAELQELAQEAADGSFLSGREGIFVDPAKEALAVNQRCKKCDRWATLGSDVCTQHTEPGRPNHNLYDMALQGAPSLLAIQEHIRDNGDFDQLDSDILLIRALTHKFVEKNAYKLEQGETEAIMLAIELVNKTAQLIEKKNGKKYTVTLTGVNVIIQQVVAILKLRLATEPKLMELIAMDLAQLKLPKGSLSL